MRVLAETLTFDAQLGITTSTVVVTGQALSNTFNRANMGAGTHISGAQLSALASIQRNPGWTVPANTAMPRWPPPKT